MRREPVLRKYILPPTSTFGARQSQHPWFFLNDDQFYPQARGWNGTALALLRPAMCEVPRNRLIGLIRNTCEEKP